MTSVTCNSEDPQILGVTIKNLVAIATWAPNLYTIALRINSLQNSWNIYLSVDEGVLLIAYKSSPLRHEGIQSTGNAAFTLKLCTRWSWVVNLTPYPLSCGKEPKYP